MSQNNPNIAQSAQRQSNVQKKAVKKPQPLVIDTTNKYVLGGYFCLGLNNFYKAILNLFAKAGIKTTNKNGTVLYPEEKIGAVLKVLYQKASNPEYKFGTEEEKAWANNFKLNSNQQVKLQKLLFHHFPMLGPIMANEAAYKMSTNKKSDVIDTYSLTCGATLSECLDVLSTIAQGLVDCRNAHAHYEPHNSKDSLNEQYALQTKIARYLNKTLTASRRLDKERNNIDTAMMEFLTGRTDNLQRYINENGFYPKYEEKEGSGKTKKMEERDDFFYKIGHKIQKEDVTYTKLSGFGLSYFCAIFLSKSQTKQMLADIKLFERSPYPEECNDIIRDMMSIYRIRAPRGKKKLEGSDSRITLALDILNELRKCPRELFDVLTPTGQEYFEDKVNPSKNIQLPEDNGGDAPDVVKRIRKIDRFPHLVMRYVDEAKLFDNIRFQVQLGKYRFKFYDKKCINGDTDVRSLQKEINGFGRLQEIEFERERKYKDILQPTESRTVKIEGDDLELDLVQFAEDTKDSTPYITDSRAFYNIHNNRIGLYWTELLLDNGRYIPKCGDYIPDMKTVADKAEVNMPAPMAMLSIYELPAMIFYQYLLSKYETGKEVKTKSAEQVIVNKYYNLRQLFTDVGKGDFAPVKGKPNERCNLLSKQLQDKYNLKLSEIPEKLAVYLSGQEAENQSKRKLSITEQRLKQRLQKAIRRRDRYKEDRKKIGGKENKYAKKGYVDVRHGALARYLSESLIEWQPTKNDGKDKLTGLNFSKLQAELATFNSPDKFESVKRMLTSAKMLKSSIAHPFLYKVTNQMPRNIEELYLFYLNEEVKYLKSFFDIQYKARTQRDDNINFEQSKLRQGVDISNIPFIHGKARWEERTPAYCRELAKRYLEVDGRRTAIWLPDGIFTKPIIDILKEHASGCLSENDETLNNNVAYLINTYFEQVLTDHSQKFYRSYKSQDGTEIPNDFARVYDLFNILNNQKNNNALVPVPMTSNQIKERFTEKVKGIDDNPIMELGPNRKPIKNAQGEYIYRKQIHEEINDYVEKMTNRGNCKSLDEAKEVMKRRLTRYINEVKNNERTIRRYKTQDMILFLMAKQLMSETVNIENCKLHDVCNENGFLNRTVNFEFPIKVEDKTVYINQDNMSLKNYGEFYQLLSDDRLPSLLKKLAAACGDEPKPVVDYNKLMGELTSYDIHRSRIFHAVHLLEKQVVSQPKYRIFLNNPCDRRFYIDDDKSKMAKRNNFKSLLQLLNEGDTSLLAEDERELIVSIRNAFSHNHYGVDFGQIADEKQLSRTTLVHKKGEEGKDTKLTTIATLIAARLEELQQSIETKVKN